MSTVLLKRQLIRVKLHNVKKRKLIFLPIIFATAIGQTVFFQLVFGKIGYLFSSIGVGALVIVLINQALRLITNKKYLLGLFLFTLFFINVDVLGTLTGLFLGKRLSWILLAPFVLYILLSIKSISKTISNNKVVLGIILFGILQIGWAILPGSEIFLSIIQRWLFYLATFLATVNFVLLSRNHLHSFMYMIVLAGLSASVMLILEYLYPSNLGISYTVRETTQRAGGLYGHSGPAAFVVSFSALILCWLVFTRQFPRLLYWPVIAIMLWAMLVTFSTQGIISIALIAIGLGLSITSDRILTSSTFATWSIALTILMLFTLNNIVFSSGMLDQIRLSRDNVRRIENLKQVFSGNISALSDEMVRSNRVNLLENSWRAVQRQPWIGYGTGVSLRDEDKYEYLYNPFLPHNVLMMIWLENGIFVMVFVVLIFMIVIYNNIIRQDSERWFRFLIIANLIAFMFARHILFYYRYTAIVLGIILVLDKISFRTRRRH